MMYRGAQKLNHKIFSIGLWVLGIKLLVFFFFFALVTNLNLSKKGSNLNFFSNDSHMPVTYFL